jgi:hypothetical protein
MAAALKPFVDEHFVDLGFFEGSIKPLQRWWQTRCAQPDMGGAYSWYIPSDVDEYLVMLERFVSTRILF